MPATLATRLTFKDQTVTICRDRPAVMIGERINPTGRKEVLAAMEAGDFASVRGDALAQVAAGALVLDVNAGVPGADEPQLLAQVLQTVMDTVAVPLSIDTALPLALEAALKLYPGKALVNSVNGEERVLQAVLPLVQDYGAAVIGLCIDDDGIPTTAEGRLAVAGKIIERAARLGIPPEDVIIDPLAMAFAADSRAGLVTLRTVELVVREFGVNVTLGASNISHGLPDRKYLNAAFLALALQAGVTCPITNPLVTDITAAVLATDLCLGRDDYGMRWIKAYRRREKARREAVAV
jgi:5-methyltetrahydrofolate--homocysteine methyltransferase